MFLKKKKGIQKEPFLKLASTVGLYQFRHKYCSYRQDELMYFAVGLMTIYNQPLSIFAQSC